jgi:DNA end-binding protein Ku
MTAPTPIAAAAPVLTPVRQRSAREGSDEVVPERSIVKGYEYEKGRYVAIDPEELKNLAPKTATEMQIQEFVKLSEIDPVYFESSYYVVPEDAGLRAYALLYQALQSTGLVALAQFAMHGREHIVVVRPGSKGLIAHTMFFSSEVRADEEYRADTGVVTQKELELAQTLIHSLSAPFEPEKYRDTYREKLEAMIAERVAGQPAAPPREKTLRTAPVVDITEALQKSLAALKKPAASEKSPKGTLKPSAESLKKKAAQTRAGR